MAAILPFVGPALGIIGTIVGSNSQNHAASAASGAADQAASAQNTLINQGELPILQALLANFTNNVAPLEPLAGQFFNGQGPEGTAFQQAMSYFGNEGRTGLDPAVISNAFNNLDVQQSRNINDIRNQLGPSLPNLAGTIKDMGFANTQAQAQLGSNLAAQDQSVRDSGMLNSANLSMQDISALMQYLTAGQNSAAGVSTGLNNIAGQYGAAGASAANNAANLTASAGNPFSAISNIFSGLQLPTSNNSNFTLNVPQPNYSTIPMPTYTPPTTVGAPSYSGSWNI